MAEVKEAARKSKDTTAREMGEAFGGTVVRIDANDCDDFFLAHEPEFTPDGRTHFLRLLGIGKALYDNQTDPTRVAILAAQKGKVRAGAEGVYALRGADSRYFFAGLATRVGWGDPREYLGLREDQGWRLAGDDEKRGILRFVNAVADAQGDWAPALFADVPYLYGRPVTLAVGLYNAHVDAAMRDALNTSGVFRFKMDEFASDEFREVSELIAGVARANADTYAQFLDALRRKRVLVEDARTVLRTAAAEKRLPRFQTRPTLKYLDVLERGGEVDVLAPKQLQNYLDLANALALYGREGAKGSLVSQARAEASLFQTLFEDVYEADGGALPPYTDMKERVAQRG